MKVHEAIRKRRSIRRFKNKKIPYKILEKLVDFARLAPSGSNLQPLEYIIVDRKDLVGEIFKILKWAGYIYPKGNPPEGEEPRAYIVVLVNKEIREKGYEHDSGLAIENICLAAEGMGLGSCIIGSIDRAKLREILGIPRKMIIDLIVALGYPNEKPIMEETYSDIKYWKDEKNVLHVPKRRLSLILHRNGY
jgi:nitroreductase